MSDVRFEKTNVVITTDKDKLFKVVLLKQSAPDVEVKVNDVSFTYHEGWIQDENLRGTDGIITDGGWEFIQNEAIRDYAELVEIASCFNVEI